VNSLAHRIKYLAWNGRWNEQAQWRRWWVRTWDWFFNRVWGTWIRPHVFPRRWEREHHALNETLRIPQRVNAFLIEEDGRYCAHLIEDGGPWDLCCLAGQPDTLEETQEEVTRMLKYWAKKAGTWSRDGTYTVMWKHRKPTAEDRTYTS